MWTPYNDVMNTSNPLNHPGVLPAGNIPTVISSFLVPEVFLRTDSVFYTIFTTSGVENGNSPVSIDQNNIRSLNEDVLKGAPGVVKGLRRF